MQTCFVDEESLGKKHDDMRPSKKPSWPSSWPSTRVHTRRSLKRLAILAVLAAAVYLFIKNIPADVPIRDRRHPVYRDAPPQQQVASPPSPPPEQQDPPPRTEREDTPPPMEDDGPSPARDAAAPAAYDFNGPLKFHHLANTLQAMKKTHGSSNDNKNILFAAASLKSAAALLAVACRMGTERRSHIHFALLSRNDIGIEDLRQINGIDDSCNVIIHDARPDYAAQSSDARFRNTVERAMYHINSHMHPQAVFIDTSHAEDPIFIDAMREETVGHKISQIELPEHSSESLGWVTRLDSSSLAAWNKISIDIVIQAHPGASGSLIRLLNSLKSADFRGVSAPHLTVELPPDIDPSIDRFLESFQWPPAHVYNPARVKQLSVRHRIQGGGVTEEESSIRFLESFWPSNPTYSHVLVLSPQVELSPHFFHYLQYTVLEYGYSNAARLQEWDRRLLGISLDLPSTFLDGSGGFSPPSAPEAPDGPSATEERARPPGEPPSFLWQAPGPDATLLLGDRWVELHGFVSRLLETQTRLPAPPPDLLLDKLVSRRHPSWAEHALRLCRARGYWTLYPSAATASGIAAVHGELYQLPEEYEERPPGDESASDLVASDGEETVLGPAPQSLLDSLPGDGGLPPFNDLPILSWDGARTSLQQLNEASLAYAAEWRRTVGRCPADKIRVYPEPSAGDLFCMGEA